MKKPVMITSLVFICIFLMISLVGPYNFLFNSLNEESVKQRFVSADNRFREQKVTGIDYKGEQTFYIETEGTDYIITADYSSLMNYEWVIMEEELRTYP